MPATVTCVYLWLKRHKRTVMKSVKKGDMNTCWHDNPSRTIYDKININNINTFKRPFPPTALLPTLPFFLTCNFFFPWESIEWDRCHLRVIVVGYKVVYWEFVLFSRVCNFFAFLYLTACTRTLEWVRGECWCNIYNMCAYIYIYI